MLRFKLLIIFFTFNFIYGQDTITVMTYNLLNFNNNTSYCTQTNNPVNVKINNLKTIVNYVAPDIIGFNEVGANNSNIQLLLDSVLNKTTISKTYERIPYINSTSSDIISTLFFNANKFALYNVNFLSTAVRDVLLVTLYYKSKELVNNNDTVFIRIIVAHLKAGSTSSDQQVRAQQTSIIMDYLNSLGNIKNTILMGDLNVYSSTEACFQNLINYQNSAIRFYDPVNKLGTWHDNQEYAMYHTQSTQEISNGCTSGGGLDDRYDFILVSFGIMNNLYKIQYLTNSYKVIGQDGNRFNMSVNNPTNVSAPSNVIEALAQISDHLPVSLKLVINQTPLIGINKNDYNNEFFSILDWNINTLNIYSNGFFDKAQINIFNYMGIMLFEKNINLAQGENYITTPTINEGLYIVRIKANNKAFYYKIVKK